MTCLERLRMWNGPLPLPLQSRNAYTSRIFRHGLRHFPNSLDEKPDRRTDDSAL